MFFPKMPVKSTFIIAALNVESGLMDRQLLLTVVIQAIKVGA